MTGFPRTADAAALLEVLPSTGSTNAVLRENAAGLPHLSVVLTRDQTAGRGRLDRSWIAPAGAALAVSVLLRDLPADLSLRGWIPLIAGAAMADAVTAQLSGHDVGVKWPNDLLVDDRKLSGILAEATAEGVIVGAGVNTRMTTAQLPVATATSFSALGAEADEDRLVAEWLERLDALLRALREEPDAARTAVAQRCLTLGREVRVELPDGAARRGRALRLDVDGRLVIDAADGEFAVAAGDIVHARAV